MSRGFDTIAPFYDQLARLVFGRAMRQSQLFFLNRLQECKSVLVIGGGTGWWVNDLIALSPETKITFIEASAKMIELAKRQMEPGSNVHFIHGALEEISLKEKHDAVVLFYFLDIYDSNSLPRIIETIKAKLTLKALWLVTDFVEEKKWHTFLLKIMYRFFGYAANLTTRTLPDWRTVLLKSKLTIVDQRAFYRDFIWASVWN
jgi:tRNA (cmo5U34)-methyltransferase